MSVRVSIFQLDFGTLKIETLSGFFQELFEFYNYLYFMEKYT